MKRIALFVFLLFSVTAIRAQDVKNIKLKQQHINYDPKGFFISDVVDELGSKQSGVLLGGAGNAVKTFINGNVSQNRSAQSIILHLTHLDIDLRKAGGEYSIEASVAMTFYVGDKKVVEYSGKGHGQTDGDPADYIEGFIRTAIENNLKKFDSWWDQNRGHVATASEVKVNITIGKTTDKPNCIVYSLQRPLAISDFTGPAEENIKELAATFSGIGLGYSGKTLNGKIVLNVVITPYFEKTKSWFKEAGKNPRVLAHEQAHFDITAIKACELADAINKAHLTQDNYDKVITELQRQNAEESNAEESLYDDETSHGTIEAKQLEWQQKIRARVLDAGCYH